MAKTREADAKPRLGEYLAAHRGRLSVRKAAGRAGISEGRWRQVEAGYESKGGMRLPVNAKPETIAAMARAVDADLEQALLLAGHDPSEHQELIDRVPSHPATSSQVLREQVMASDQPAYVKRAMLALLDASDEELPDRKQGVS